MINKIEWIRIEWFDFEFSQKKSKPDEILNQKKKHDKTKKKTKKNFGNNENLEKKDFIVVIVF
mgnify:CR=1 FL=1